MGYQVILSLRSIRDPEDIVRYVAPPNADAVKALGLALIARSKSLSEFPELGGSSLSSASHPFGRSSSSPTGSFIGRNPMAKCSIDVCAHKRRSV